MKTVRKALALLHHFTVNQAHWGLSDLARAAGLDKAGTLRLLRPLVDEGFLEQDANTRKYRLGYQVLTLAQVREASFPLVELMQPILQQLVERVGEVAHVSIAQGDGLSTVAVANSVQRATRVFVDPSETLPYHATASGMVCLAFGEPQWSAERLAQSLFTGVTAQTPHDAHDLAPYIERARQSGYATTRDTFEAEVTGTAMPIFDARGFARGAVAIAAPSSRVDETRITDFVRELKPAAEAMTQALGGVVPKAWSALLA